MKKIFITITTLLFFTVLSQAQIEKTRYQIIKSNDIDAIVQTFDFANKGVDCTIDQELKLSTANTVAIEITVKSSNLPPRILQSLLDEGQFDLLAKKLKGKLVLDINQSMHVIKYKDVEEALAITYTIYIPEHVRYVKANKKGTHLSSSALVTSER